MNDIDHFADFITQAHRSIELIGTPDEYARTVLSITGAPEFKRIPDDACEELTHHLERKRNDVIRALGALVG